MTLADFTSVLDNQYYTDYWGAYTRHLDPEEHTPDKRNTQKIERKHLTLRTRIKRLVRKTICFSKSTQMHDIVIPEFEEPRHTPASSRRKHQENQRELLLFGHDT